MLSNREREIVKLFAMLKLTEKKKPRDPRLWREWRRHRHELRQEIKKVSPSYLRVLRHRIKKKVRDAYYDLALVESSRFVYGDLLRDWRVGIIIAEALGSPGESDEFEKDEVLDFYENGYALVSEGDSSTLKELFSPSEE